MEVFPSPNFQRTWSDPVDVLEKFTCPVQIVSLLAMFLPPCVSVPRAVTSLAGNMLLAVSEQP